MTNPLTNYLRKYSRIQPTIMVVYRPTLKSWWGDRTLINNKEYDKNKEYNHRSILDNEIVIEFDNDDKKINSDNTNKVCTLLKSDGVKYSKWSSGNKSTHVHFMIRTNNAKNLPLLKKVVMRHYTIGCTELPDLRLAASNHLVRAEYGIHEKTGKHKKKIYESKGYPYLGELNEVIWFKYTKAYNTVLKRRATTEVNQLDGHPALKYVLTSEVFRQHNDARERTLFMLIHVLKPKYVKDELVRFLQDWYRYSGGFKLSDVDIKNKVSYHWNREYTFGLPYLTELLESVGVDINDIK